MLHFSDLEPSCTTTKAALVLLYYKLKFIRVYIHISILPLQTTNALNSFSHMTKDVQTDNGCRDQIFDLHSSS